MKVLETKPGFIKVRVKRWFMDAPDIWVVKWDPKSDTGKVKSAIVAAGLATYFDWGGGATYNDAGQFRKSDNTYKRALKWKFSTLKRFTNAQKAKLERELRKRLKNVEEVIVNSPYGDKTFRTKGDLYVYLRVRVCDC